MSEGGSETQHEMVADVTPPRVSDAHAPASMQDATASRDDMLLAFVASHDAACPLCRYNLRGLTRATCPECGQGLSLRVGLTEPFLAAWIVMMVAVSACAGFGLFCIVGVLNHGFPSADPHVVLIMIYFMACVPGAVGVLAGRRAFMRLPKGAQKTAAGVLVFLTAVSFIVVMADIMR